MQCGAAWCSVVRCGAVWCSVVQCGAVCCSVLQCVAVCCSVLQCVAVRSIDVRACVYIHMQCIYIYESVHVRPTNGVSVANETLKCKMMEKVALTCGAVYMLIRPCSAVQCITASCIEVRGSVHVYAIVCAHHDSDLTPPRTDPEKVTLVNTSTHRLCVAYTNHMLQCVAVISQHLHAQTNTSTHRLSGSWRC